MKPALHRFALAAAAGLACAAWASGPGIASIRPGMWEMSERQTIHAMNNLDRATLDRMNERQRTNVRRTCISPAEAARGPRLLRTDGCRWEHYSVSGGNVSGTKICPNGSGTRRHDYSGVVRADSYSITETISFETPSGPAGGTNQLEGRRVGACG